IARTSELSHRRTLLLSHYILISDNVVYGEFKDALARLKCPFGVSHPPRWEDGEEQRFRIIWLERNQTIPSRVSRTLAQAGFPSVGQLLLKPEP
ncbi:hypothetical protein ACP6ET_28215, partial [Klebsiella quasipneumoniae]